MATVITAGTVLTPLEAIANGAVLVRDGRIEAVDATTRFQGLDAKRLDFPEDILVPGFIDLHVHGAVGYDVMDADDGGYTRIGRFLAKHGVTSYLPTTITATEESLLGALGAMSSAVARPPAGVEGVSCARPIGIHLEGPFLSNNRVGVHPSGEIREPNIKLLEHYIEAARGAICILTIAPELPGALEITRDACARGIVVAFGHTNASFEVAEEAIAAGVRHSTHTFNAMRRVMHRDPGVVGAILCDRRVYADIVADGLHVHPPMIDLFLRCKGRDRAILVSDSSSVAGMPMGRYRLGNFEVEIDGLRVDSHGKLGGSVLTLDVAVQNVMAFAGWSLQNAIRLVTLNPAELLGLVKKGRITAGADADLVVLSPSGEVRRTFVSGQ